MRLFLLRGVILCVFRQVAMRARLRDMLDDARALHGLTLLQLVLQCGIAERGHWNLFHRLFCPSVMRNPDEPARDAFSSGMTGAYKPGTGPSPFPSRNKTAEWLVVPAKLGFIANHLAGRPARLAI